MTRRGDTDIARPLIPPCRSPLEVDGAARRDRLADLYIAEIGPDAAGTLVGARDQLAARHPRRMADWRAWSLPDSDLDRYLRTRRPEAHASGEYELPPPPAQPVSW